MTDLLKRLLARHDLKITHNRSDVWSPDLDLLGFIGSHVFRESAPRTILQIGANDGFENDWLRQFVQRDGVHALLVEPLPEPYAKLADRYRDSVNVQCVQAALTNSPGQARIYRATFSGECPPKFSRIASFEKRVIRKHEAAIRRAGGTISTLVVPAVSAEDLLEMMPGDGPELIGIDVEGFDAIAAMLLLDAGARPSMFVYEHSHTRGADDEQCLSRLREAGYRLARINRDTVAVKADIWDAA